MRVSATSVLSAYQFLQWKFPESDISKPGVFHHKLPYVLVTAVRVMFRIAHCSLHAYHKRNDRLD